MTIIRGSRLNYNAAIMSRYRAALVNLVDRMTDESNRRIERLFRSGTATEFYESHAMDADIASQARILTNALARKFDSLFSEKAKKLAERMIKESGKESKRALKASIKAMTKGVTLDVKTITPELRTVLRASVNENVELIKSISSEYFTQVQGAVMRSIVSGNGLKSLIPALRRHKGITQRRAKNIALDQTRKVYTAFNNERMIGAGLDQFEWGHTGGSKEPRPDHIALNGKIFYFDMKKSVAEGGPPVIDKKTGERGYPAQAPNCKCVMIPVYKFDDNEGKDDAVKGRKKRRS